ncbi:MAG: cell division protein ZapA [Candidatus Marinimicrobia bacterium]|jgi:cell division protein ZapA|nr:cell division protein ZapA [Candidatus Neomarinimicrobiota bacterium]MBT3675811.1 cell division protein ZapA [Candidatus Neomarinimicrobiota bacterium]MBT3762973.1 cell division protein ZapA [Candidatus Neomarinimicrobiota bacterium]MBT4069120.1 cell division protein ZapA [Candidatus Neomarinimicrobiota bacterium]MBT4271506.1 cell division protein ZapA [Candidatus Neomarinimicrobiota bacterium]
MSDIMDGSENYVKVTIYGQEYTIKAPADATYIKNIAEYVDMKMREVQDELATPQVPAKVAILAAMNISDDLFSANQQNEKIKNDVETKISSLIEIVDEAIQH